MSDRARRARLTMSRRDGLVVVVPRDFEMREVPLLLAAHRPWVERMIARIERERGLLEPEPANGLPTAMRLRAVGEEWMITYQETGVYRVAAFEHEACRLFVQGGTADVEACRAALRRWLHRKAKRELLPWLEHLSEEIGLIYDRAGVRSQRTRWGSCSTRGTITLNAKCLFLPRDLVEHMMLHELCHTILHDHSDRFHEMVRAREQDMDEKAARLRTAWRFVPGWAEA